MDSLTANTFNGEFRGYNVFAGNAQLSCFDLENVPNPTRLYGFVAGHCATGINLVSSQTQEFHGASVFENNIDISVTGTRDSQRAYIVFDNLQLGHAKNEIMYLDQQNETVVCVSNCTFKDMNLGKSSGGVNDSAIVIGPDASNALGQTNTILRLNQGYIDPSGNTGDYQDIRFDTGGGSTTCICTVALGDGMIDLVNGVISNNSSGTTASVSGPLTFSGPQAGPNLDLANNIGLLNLSPSEIGMGVTTGTSPVAGKAGLKLSVRCHGSHSGEVDLVAMAGTGSSVVLNTLPIGANVAACQ